MSKNQIHILNQSLVNPNPEDYNRLNDSRLIRKKEKKFGVKRVDMLPSSLYRLKVLRYTFFSTKFTNRLV